MRALELAIAFVAERRDRAVAGHRAGVAHSAGGEMCRPSLLVGCRRRRGASCSQSFMLALNLAVGWLSIALVDESRTREALLVGR